LSFRPQGGILPGLGAQDLSCRRDDRIQQRLGKALFFDTPPGIDAEQALHRELNDPDYRNQLTAHNAYNRQLFDLIYERAMQGEGVLLSWTTAYRHANYPDAPAIAASKSFIMSPWTDLKAIDSVVQQVLDVRTQITGL